eukprot:GDKI01029415.1.p1 GENE.GDKI01029415.1~~GDKI01029415.1.p1  ORF type:complete len:228 (-),score=16.39 GDKI01029415.1:20-703(-)
MLVGRHGFTSPVVISFLKAQRIPPLFFFASRLFSTTANNHAHFHEWCRLMRESVHRAKENVGDRSTLLGVENVLKNPTLPLLPESIQPASAEEQMKSVKLIRKCSVEIEAPLDACKHAAEEIIELKVEKSKLMSLQTATQSAENREVLALVFTGFCGAFSAAIHPIFLVGFVYGIRVMSKSAGAEKKRLAANQRLEEIHREMGVLRKIIQDKLNEIETQIPPPPPNS